MSTTNSITTKIGDQGTTQLLSGEFVSKNSPQTNAYGDLDEVVSILGVARALTQDATTAERIVSLQRWLFVVGAELATRPEHVDLLSQRVNHELLAELERDREILEAALTMPTGFVLPGGSPAAAHLDLARAVARRCERKAVGLLDEGLLENQALVVWLNRLSDYLWLMARAEEGAATLMKDG